MRRAAVIRFGSHNPNVFADFARDVLQSPQPWRFNPVIIGN
jgi:hypothetical protein